MVLKLDNVSKAFIRFGRHVDAARNVSLELEDHDFIGILGPGGAGKTTLLKLAAGLETPDNGSVEYRGKPLSSMSKAAIKTYRRREVGCVWGSEHLYPGLSVLENVSLPLLFDAIDRSDAERTAWDTLESVDAHRIAGARPHELSENDRQRVSVAQALVTQPRILLLDELATNLSFFEQDSLFAVLKSLAQDKKMAMLAADTEATALFRSSPILYLEDGQLVTQKSRDELGEVIDLPVNHPKKAM